MSSKQTNAKAGRSSRLPILLGILLAVGLLLLARSWLWPGKGPAPLPIPTEVVTTAPSNSPDNVGDSRFTRLGPEQTGIDHVLPIDTNHPLKYLYFSGTTGGGIAIGDIDQDGMPDIYLVSGPGKNRLFRQVAPLKFEEVKSARVDGGDAWGTGATFVDINNDGRLDIYVCNFDAPNNLYVNFGNGQFHDRAAHYGVDITDASMSASFADYDRDGDLDMYLLTYRYERPEGFPLDSPVIGTGGDRRILPEYAKYYRPTDDAWGFGPVGRSDGLLRNEGNESFVDVTEKANIRGLGHGLSVMWWDYDEDGWPDIYVANDFADADQLFRNNRNGTFDEVIADTVPHTTWFSMGSDVGDLNRDGHLDLLVADMSATTHYRQKVAMGNMGDSATVLQTAIPRQYMRNALLLNSATPRMMEAAYLAGLADSDWTWTVKVADFDNDGWEDVYFTNGAARDFTNADIPFDGNLLRGKTNWDVYEQTTPLREKNLAFRNRGDLQFENVSQPWGLDHHGISMAAAHADLDRDGDLDLVVMNLDEPVSVYRNDLVQGDERQQHHHLLLRLVGRESNRFGIGARVFATTDSGTMVRQLQPVSGFLASNEPLLHFGLGQDSLVRSLTIQWPSGVTQTLDDVVVDHLVTVVEEADTGPIDTKRSDNDIREAPSTIFDAALPLANVVHRERDFDDFHIQPLLPNRLSRLGPGMAWADVDGNGWVDAYLGGAAGQAGSLILQIGPGEFQQTNVAAFEADAQCEDLGATWLDLEGDGDLDLYVVSGGFEYPPDDPRLADRLYVNDGAMNFSRADELLHPGLTTAGSVVASADFDRDGDLDLFIGTRFKIQEYPLSLPSTWLRNDNGRLVVANDDVCDTPALADLGMVTSAVWSDVNDDGWPDLLVATEWGAVRCLINRDGKLSDATSTYGLAATTGWWNGIASCDVDADGDFDLVVTNTGLNTKYHATVEQPALLYYGDFSGDGQRHLIEAEFEDTTLFPVRGKSCSTNAMPHLANKFPTFHDF
ncbi:MAG: VCBS repeat-containing protein, partial [Planctomycetales bacterium]|nr:VCBS repeat-containing protein [Planctomycetales bacterium]